jgi:hypothetical protein
MIFNLGLYLNFYYKSLDSELGLNGIFLGLNGIDFFGILWDVSFLDTLGYEWMYGFYGFHGGGTDFFGIHAGNPSKKTKKIRTNP